MNTKITIGNTNYDAVCNLGSEQLYRHLTGHDFNLDLTRIERGSKSEDISERTSAASELLEITKKLAFIMIKQAGERDISRLLANLAEAEYIGWLCQFNPGDFTQETYTQIISCWKKTKETSVPAKN